MRTENQIYCSNCGTLIRLEARFCATCGFKQVDFPIASNTENKLTNEETNSKIDKNKIELENNEEGIPDNSTKIVGVLFFLFVLFVLLIIFHFFSNSSKTAESSIVGNEKSAECTGPGNSTCESVVKHDINKTPQWEVLSISHYGDGKFGVTYLAPSRSGGLTDYYAEYFTDCRCKITNVNFKNSPPL